MIQPINIRKSYIPYHQPERIKEGGKQIEKTLKQIKQLVKSIEKT